jgi:hypothetical protein
MKGGLRRGADRNRLPIRRQHDRDESEGEVGMRGLRACLLSARSFDF